MNQIPEDYKKPIDLIRTPKPEEVGDEVKIYAVKNRDWFEITDDLVTPELLDQINNLEIDLNTAEGRIEDLEDRPTYEVFTRTEDGLTPKSGGTSGTDKFLNEDGTWRVPDSSGGGGAGFSYYGSNIIPLTYQDIPVSKGSNSFVSADLANGDAYLLDIDVSDMSGSGGGGDLTYIYVKIFGVEFSVHCPYIFEDWVTINLRFLISAGAGSSSSRSITLKLLEMSSSNFGVSPDFFLANIVKSTSNIDLSTAKTIEMKMSMYNTGPTLEFARMYKI